MIDRISIEIEVNGRTVAGDVEPRRTLADFLREDAGFTGTHLGCEHGVCGACTVLVDGVSVRSCIMYAVQAHGSEVTTVESLATEGDGLHPVLQAFKDCHGLQCGFCTSGMIMTIVEFLGDESEPAEPEIREALAGNLCRCTGYEPIVAAVKQADATWDRADAPSRARSET